MTQDIVCDTGSMGIDSLVTEWACAMVKIRGIILGWGGGVKN